MDICQYPPKEWLPSNVTMRALDAFSEVPDDLVGIYDIVHLRLFACVIKDNNPEPVLANVIRMLSSFFSPLLLIALGE